MASSKRSNAKVVKPRMKRKCQGRIKFQHCYKILKDAGAGRVSPEAVEELQKTVENIALDVSKRAVLFAGDEARVRVTRKDLKAALEEFFRSVSLDDASFQDYNNERQMEGNYPAPSLP